MNFNTMMSIGGIILSTGFVCLVIAGWVTVIPKLFESTVGFLLGAAFLCISNIFGGLWVMIFLESINGLIH